MVLIVPKTRKILETSFETEKQAAQRFDELMQPYFHLIGEVWLQHYDGAKLRIDRVGVPRREARMGWAPLVGFELKKNTFGIGGLTKALNQAIDYRDCIITDARFSNFRGCRLPFVFVFPDSWDVEDPHAYAQGLYGGAVRQAGRRNVGLVRWENHYGVLRLLLHASGQKLWASDAGSSKTAATFGTARGRGSA